MSNELFKGYSFELEDNKPPVAVILPSDQQAVVGSIVKLDGRSSVDPEGNGLTYTWSFVQTPIGSQVEKFGFTDLEDDSSIVTFAPDLIGTYRVQLVVSDGSLSSDPAVATVDTRIILVPHHSGIIPDASFIWNYLSDFWAKVDGRKRFETFWSSAIEIVASEMLKLYQYDYNKSIRDIQEVVQKRWLSFSPALVLDRTKVSFILADDQAGSSASTFVLDTKTGLPLAAQPSFSNLVTVPVTEGSFGAASSGRLLQIGDRAYTMIRSGSVSRSIDYAKDGATASGTTNFTGSGFTASMVGATLRILTGALAGDYKISSFTSSTAVHVMIALPGGVTTWPSTLSGLTYTVIPATGNYSGFFADLTQIPAGQDNQNWRFSSTLVSEEWDFEAQGVCVGDVLEVEIVRTDLNLFSTTYAQVVSVDRGRLGFVLNLQDLTDGVSAGWLTDDMKALLAADLQVRGLLLGSDGTFTYTGQSATIKQLLSSGAFRKTYFETELTPDSEINLGPFSITARPVQVYRNRMIPVDETLVSVPVLQEYIKQPQVVQADGKLTLITDGGQTAASRAPYLLVENLDYVVDGDSKIQGVCSMVAGSDVVTIPYGDLLDRSIREQDSFIITVSGVDTTYTILRVLGTDTLRVFPTPDTTGTSIQFKIQRRVPGTFIRFVRNTFTKRSPSPPRLWGEVCYFDNNDVVENNFGSMVAVSREDLSRVNSAIPYKSAVAGLMYALVNGPTISNLALAAQILLGLPFTLNRGVITAIDPKYRLNDDGSPLFGRVLVEARDTSNTPLGITNIYLYPRGRQIPDPSNPGEWLTAVPDFSGLAINPNTGVEFAVGDSVDQFVPLSKGVQVQDYLATPDWVSQLTAQGNLGALLQQYHSFQILINADLVSTTDIDLAAQFIRRAKPTYTKITSAIDRSTEDFVTVTDTLLFGRTAFLYETPGLGIPTAIKYDDRDEDEAIVSTDGLAYTRYFSGSDLVTTQGSSQVTSAAGGFINTRLQFSESHDTPFIRPGDVLEILSGSNAGSFNITSVVSDGTLALDLTTPGVTFETGTTQAFNIYRPIQNPIWVGKVTTNGTDQVLVKETSGAVAGIGSAGVAVGDLLVFSDLSSLTPTPSAIYTVIEVDPSSTSPFVRVLPNIVEADGTYNAWIVRGGLQTNGIVTPFGATSPGFIADFALGSTFITFSGSAAQTDWLNVALIQPGALVFHGSDSYLVLATDPSTRRVAVSPALTITASGEPVTVQLRPDRPSTPLSTDFLDRVPADYLDLELDLSLSAVGEGLITGVGSPDVQSAGVIDFIDLGVMAGDYVVLLAGTDSSRDIGHGPGVFPILVVLDSFNLRLVEDLTQTNLAPGVRYGILRKRRNEG